VASSIRPGVGEVAITEHPDQEGQFFCKTLEKGLRALSLFGENEGVLSLSQVAKAIGTNKTSAYRIVNTLLLLGYLRRDPRTRALGVGPRAMYLGNALRSRFDLVRIVRPVIDAFHARLNMTVDSAVFSDDMMISLYRLEAKETLILKLPVMMRDIHTVALGKAALSFLPDGEMVEVVGRLNLTRRTKNTIVSKDLLIAELRRTRERGYALNNEELIRGLISVGAPLVSSETRRPIGAVSIDSSTVEHRVDVFKRRYSSEVRELAWAISRTIP
jgi:IclR family pca regulon transcriptional regulator